MLFSKSIPLLFHKVTKKWEDFWEKVWYSIIAESRRDTSKGGGAKEAMRKITPKRVVEELAAIGFARATNFLCVSDGKLIIRSTDTLSKADQAAIASVEQTSNGIRLKFYDKMKALELLGKYMGIFEGKPTEEEARNNLLEAILAATREEVESRDIPEIQQTADDRDDLVEPAGSGGL